MPSYFDAVMKEIESSQSQIDKIFALGKNRDQLNVTILKEKQDKEKLATLVLELTKRTQACVALLKRTSGAIESAQIETKLAGDKIIRLQGELLNCKSEQIDQFRSLVEEKLSNTIKTELKSYSDAVKTNFGEPLTISNIKTAVKDVVKTVNASSKVGREMNLIMFGLHEEPDENLVEKVADVFSDMGEKPRFDAVRIGSSDKRPVRITFDRTETVHELVKVGHTLKSSGKYSNIFISLDRSPEQRAERRKLVEKMKVKIKENPDRRFYIKRGEVHCENEETPRFSESISEKYRFESATAYLSSTICAETSESPPGPLLLTSSRRISS